jgi:iron complex transport system ATP-binding protein|tara:strand:- start:13875 stop:14642 length:768 start_codon:yes stop_codon:yes gene_type:complete
VSALRTEGLEAGVGKVTACRDLNLVVKPGEVWSVLGRNGVGKSTLLLTLAGLKPLRGGQIQVEGTALGDLSRRQRARRLSILFQNPDVIFPTTVFEAVMTGRHPWISGWKGTSANDTLLVREQLTRMGLAGFEARALPTLSGGERRRVDLAALAVQQTTVVLMDEPVNHLDLHYQVQLLQTLLEDWRQAGQAVIMVMHDINLAMRFSDRLLLLYGDGETCQGLVADVATEENLSRLYQHALHRYPAGGHSFFWPL